MITLSTSAPSAAAGELLARYELLDELGRGGGSVVYRARDGATDREVAVKVIADADAGATALRAARLTAALRHPHIVETLAVERAGGASALVTAYVAGGTLRAALRASLESGELWTYSRVAEVLRDVASALAHAHDNGVVHCDVKPENILLDAASGRALLADFGIARPPGSGRADEDTVGTPTYMAPEQIAGDRVDARADVYALGLVGWEMLAGRRPWQGEPLAAVLEKQRCAALPSLAALRPDIPAYLLGAIEGALTKAPDARWTDGAALLAALTPTPAQLPPIADARPGGAEPDGDATTARFSQAELVEALPPRAAIKTPTRVTSRVRPALLSALGVGLVAAIAAGYGADAARAGGHPAPRAARGLTRTPVRAAGPAPTLVPVPPAAAPVAQPPVSAVDLAADIRAADARVDTEYNALLGVIRASAGGVWVPPALGDLQTEQRRWAAERRAICGQTPAPRSSADATMSSTTAVCWIAAAERRARALAARRMRFATDDGAGGGDAQATPR